MKKEKLKSLPDNLFDYLQKNQFTILTTITNENKPFVNAISWIYAKNTEIVRFAVDAKSIIVNNIKINSEVALSVFSDETIYTIYGVANILTDTIEGIPFKLAIIEVNITEVYDIMFYGSKIAILPQYEKTYNKDTAEKLDQQVLEALKA